MKTLEELQAELEIYKKQATIMANENAELRKKTQISEKHEAIIFYGIEAKILKWVYSDNFRKYLAKQARGIKAQDIDDNIRLQMIDI